MGQAAFARRHRDVIRSRVSPGFGRFLDRNARSSESFAMQADLSARWLTTADLVDLSVQLQAFHGYRTVWLDDGGRLWHAEPDDLLEEQGFRYLGSFLRPSVDELAALLAPPVAA